MQPGRGASPSPRRWSSTSRHRPALPSIPGDEDEARAAVHDVRPVASLDFLEPDETELSPYGGWWVCQVWHRPRRRSAELRRGAELPREPRVVEGVPSYDGSRCCRELNREGSSGLPAYDLIGSQENWC